MKQYKAVVFTRFRNPDEEVKKALRELSELAEYQPSESWAAEIEAAATVSGTQVLSVSAQSAGGTSFAENDAVPVLLTIHR